MAARSLETRAVAAAASGFAAFALLAVEHIAYCGGFKAENYH